MSNVTVMLQLTKLKYHSSTKTKSLFTFPPRRVYKMIQPIFAAGGNGHVLS